MNFYIYFHFLLGIEHVMYFMNEFYLFTSSMLFLWLSVVRPLMNLVRVKIIFLCPTITIL